MVFCAYVVPTAPMKSWPPFPVNGGDSVLRSVGGAWCRQLLTWSIMLFPMYQCCPGFSHCRFRLQILFAAHPHLLSPVLQVISRAISIFLIKQAGFKRPDAQTGAITLIQRFGSAANLNIHLHCLVLDGVYRMQNGVSEHCTYNDD